MFYKSCNRKGTDVKPFLKWAGNKFQILQRILEVLPSGGRLIEPFVGSGAVFLNTDYPSYLLTDTNRDLITLYGCLQEDGESFIEYCRSFFTPKNNAEEVFYTLRAEFNTTEDRHLKAALFLFLNRHCYNGLCRYNAKGEFNAPFGRYKKPYFPAQEMRFFSDKANRQKAIFQVWDFEKAMRSAKPGDVVYCDPPYVPLSRTANFTNYSTGGFDLESQQRLADVAKEVAGRGLTVVISNHDTDFTRRAYANADLISFQVQRYISCNGANRGKAAELLAVYAPAPNGRIRQG
jgi:DNA adenine methylase